MLDESVQYELKTFEDEQASLIKWFVEGDLELHLNKTELKKDILPDNLLPLLLKICQKQGMPHLFTKFVIRQYRCSASFNSARDRYECFISPYLKYFSREDFIELISAINDNYQIYECFLQQNRNDKIMEHASALLSGFDFSIYPKFVFTPLSAKQVAQDFEGSSYEDDEDGELPF